MARAVRNRAEVEIKLSERRSQLRYSVLFLGLWAFATLYNLKARMFALAVITMVLLAVEVARFTSIRRSIPALEAELDRLPPEAERDVR